MLWQTSPAAAELEEVVLDWLRQMIGLPDGFSGVIQDTASTATLCALLSARERATGFEANETGLRAPLTVYASEEAHSSVDKGVRIAGFGRRNLRRIPTDDRLRHASPRSSRRPSSGDQEAGLVPALRRGHGRHDLLRGRRSAAGPIGEICRQHGVWLHVDAAWAGTAALLPEKRWMLDGAELADSLVFNPHKWMLTNFDCSAYFVRDPGALIRTFEIHPEYLKTGVDAKVKNYRDWGIQLGRRFRALKLWFVVRSYGVEGLQAMVREHLRLAGAGQGLGRGRRPLRAPGPGRPRPRLLPAERRPRRRPGSTRSTAAPARADQRRRAGLPDPHDAARQVRHPAGRGPADDRGAPRPRRLGYHLRRGRRGPEGLTPPLIPASGHSGARPQDRRSGRNTPSRPRPAGP
ncbi:MAG: pyridoxal-dependent decarboxylase [Comamonadaceae bacterium]|nr:pyridoxal-dependent decarboxylase [Comamonadaceae bacterium]